MTDTRSRFLLASVLVAVLASLLFVPGLPGEFVFDDIPNITNNQAVHLERLDAEGLVKAVATPQPSGVMRTLPTLTFALDWWRGRGANPGTFKTTNLVIHALTALALAWFLRTLLLAVGTPASRACWLAPVLALAWAAHPLHVSAVLYTVQRLQTMGTLFLVLALWAYLRGRLAQIDGQSGRHHFLGAALLWALALGCKEDSVLLPAYALALELTVLRFGAADAALSTRLRRGYLAAVLLALAAWALVVVPHYWSWEAHPGRDFSTAERLLTQPRVLCLYLWQILVPLPGHMPFYYDWLQPSRGLLQPWTTLAALVLVLALAGVACALRKRLPLVSFGLLLFLASHAIASNVVPLELAFEHRNHLGLAGIVLAVGSLLTGLGQRLRLPRAAGTVFAALVFVALGIATVQRAHDWRSAEAIARAGTVAAPGSGRAWVQLCASQFRAGGGATRQNTMLDEAIGTCTRGGAQAPWSLNSLTLLIVLKSLRGDLATDDWDQLQERARTVPMLHDNARVFTILVSHYRLGVEMDKDELAETLDILTERAALPAQTLSNLAYFVMHDLADPERAVPFMLRTIDRVPPDDLVGFKMAAKLRNRGRPDLAERVEAATVRRHTALGK
jgi:hypothetical protein